MFVIPLLRVYTREERKGDIMKINLLGAIVLIGGVASLTAACSGNPLKPQALNPGFGDGGSSNGSVNLSDPRFVGPALEVCANQPPATTDENGDVVEAPVAMCDVAAPAPEEPAADEAPAADAAVSDSAASETPLAIKRFHR